MSRNFSQVHPGIRLGRFAEADKPFLLPYASFDTHWHLIGGTGKGKTTALHTILHQIVSDPIDPPCVVVVDRLGGLTHELLMWMASPYCPQYVRDRLLYIEPAREDKVLGFNPLLFDTPAHGYYRAAASSNVVLRGWANQDLAAMPRLARWLFHSFYAAALLGLTIADCNHLVTPDSPLHARLLACLPPLLQSEWREIANARGAQAVQILESTRNRLRAYFHNPILSATFGATTNRLDVRRFRREGRIVLINLAPGERIPEEVADAYGGLVIYEVLSAARSTPPGERRPLFLMLDEFQNFVGPDLAAAIPEVRQLGVRLLLSHQSLSQLCRGETDLTNLIFQCQSRMIFGVQGEDADLLAHELASLHFDPRKIKDLIYSLRQRLTGHRIVELESRSFTEGEAANWSRTIGNGWNRGESKRTGDPKATKSEGSSENSNDGSGGGRSSGSTHGFSQHLVPIHEDVHELVNKTYVTFEEDKQRWARDIRRLERGSAFVRLVDRPDAPMVNVERDTPGFLDWTVEEIARYYPQALAAKEELLAKNFAQDVFCSPQAIERETQERLERVLGVRIILPSVASASPLSLADQKVEQAETGLDQTQEKNPFLE